MTFLVALGVIFYILVLLAGLLIVPLGLPGIWLIVAGALVYSFFGDFDPGRSDFWVLFFTFLLALVGEGIEFYVGVVGSKKMKVKTGAIVSSLIGGILGAIIGVPVALVGSLLGLFAGVFLGAFIYELFVEHDIQKAVQAALVVFFSRVTALFIKTVVAFGMVVYLLMKLF